MDHYPEFQVSEREYQSSRCSRQNSISSSTGDKSVRHSLEAPEDNHASQPRRTKTTSSKRDSHDDNPNASANDHDDTAFVLAEYSKYTDAPPAYSEKQYEGKSSEEVNRMRKRDYAIEISRIMGRQLVRGLKLQQGASRNGSRNNSNLSGYADTH